MLACCFLSYKYCAGWHGVFLQQALGGGVGQMGPGRGMAVNGMGLGMQQPPPPQQQPPQPQGLAELQQLGLGGSMGSSFGGGGGGGRSMLGIPEQMPFDMNDFPALANR